MTISNKNLTDKDRDTDKMVSVLEKFHKDFKETTNKSLRIDKARNERELDERKRQTLGSVSNTSISNVTNISRTAKDRSGASMRSMVIPSKTDKETVDELKGINKTIVTTSEKESKKGKSVLKNSILQARVLEAGFNIVKDFFFGGVTDTDRIVNAVNNVEQAIVKGDKIVLDERSKFQKFAERLPDSSVIKSASKTIPTKGTTGERIAGAIGSGSAAMGGSVTGFIDSIMDSFASADKDPKVKKSTEEATGNMASMIMDFMNKGMGKVLGAELLNKKSGFLGAMALFGSSTDFAMSTAILNPMKTLKLAYMGFSKSLGVLVDRPLLQGIALSTTTFGGLAGALSTVLLPLAKIIRPLTRDLPSLGDAFKAARSNIADALKGTKDFLTEHTGKMLGKFRKSMGKKFIMAGVLMGMLGAKMLGIMGTVMAAATAVWAGIVAASIAALPFIIGGLIVAAIVGIGYLVYKNWSKISASWNEYIVQPIVDFMISAVDKFKSLKETITGAITGFFGSILDGARTAIEMLPFGDTISNKLFGEKKASSEETSVVAPMVNEFKPTIMNAAAKQESNQTIISNDNSQNIKSQPEIIRTQMVVKENNEDNKKVMKKLDVTLKELSRNMNNQQQPVAAVPQSNVDDLGTLLVTMGG